MAVAHLSRAKPAHAGDRACVLVDGLETWVLVVKVERSKIRMCFGAKGYSEKEGVVAGTTCVRSYRAGLDFRAVSGMCSQCLKASRYGRNVDTMSRCSCGRYCSVAWIFLRFGCAAHFDWHFLSPTARTPNLSLKYCSRFEVSRVLFESRGLTKHETW